MHHTYLRLKGTQLQLVGGGETGGNSSSFPSRRYQLPLSVTHRCKEEIRIKYKKKYKGARIVDRAMMRNPSLVSPRFAPKPSEIIFHCPFPLHSSPLSDPPQLKTALCHHLSSAQTKFKRKFQSRHHKMSPKQQLQTFG